VKSGVEQCDGTDLGGATCATATAAGWVGVVSCTSLCGLDISGCNPPTTNWSTLTTTSNWSTFDVSALFPGAKGFASSAFDGKYLYLVPNNNGNPDGVVTRFDTTAGFGSSSSWETFDIATVNSSAKGFIGGAFDGKYVYFIPFSNGAYDGNIARYDTTGGFGSPSSWEVFDISTVNPSAKGFVRGTFDGRYLYLAPHYNGAYDGVTVRYDSHGAFTDATSWQAFDIGTVNANAKGFLGTIYDGRYVYYAPYNNGTVYHGFVTRFDTQAAGGFADKTSWSTFNVATVNANAVGFYSMAFDGTYLYFGQYYDGTAAVPAYGGFVARYNTTAAFNAAASWSVFNSGTLDASAKGYVGAAFDGRYVFFASHYDGTNYTGTAVRYDTQGAGFGNAGAWATFDASTLSANAKGFHGMGFDGQYMYFIPNSSAAGVQAGTVARFNTKTPGWLPLGWNVWFD
jgi:antitoxin component YwqK of YwqJK toxin-antitoxin module